MDGPFGALDPISRESLQREFADLHRRLRKTVVFVTHDIEEAVLLSDRVVLMRMGRIEQVGAPEELFGVRLRSSSYATSSEMSSAYAYSLDTG